MDNRIKRIFTNRHRMHTAAILCLLVIYTSAQAWVQKQPQQNSLPAVQQPSQKDKRIIELKQASLIDKRLGFIPNQDIGFVPDVLINDVILYHDGAYMYCDSAYLYREANRFEAFGTVRVEQGDTLFLYGKYLEYDGNSQMFKVRREVRLVNTNDNVTLFTDSLDYHRLRNIGYYFDGGVLMDTLNELTSSWGQYEPSKRMAQFRDKVKLDNPKFTMDTDTLWYSTESKVATFYGFTTIVSDSANIYSTRGWYNTVTEESLLLDQSRIVNKEGYRSLIGDSIFYNKQERYGEVFGNMFLEDTIKKMILKGDYGFYNDSTDYAMATKRAMAIEYSQGDSLFIHADTLKLITDSLSKIIKGYYGVRFFRTDVQGVCDSLQFNSADSILHLYRNPVLWNENQQILGDTITVYFNDSTVEMAHVRPNAFAIQDKDSVHFNQLKGKDLKAYFEEKEVRHIYIEGNAESIFYPEEKDKSMIGMNQTESSYLSMNFRNKKVERIKLWPKATGKMTPIPDLRPDQMRLRNFEWHDYLRPISRDDIFREVKKKDSNTSAGRRRSPRVESPLPITSATSASVATPEASVAVGSETKESPVEPVSEETTVSDNSQKTEATTKTVEK
ncbi:hypothetical protein LJC00_03015 [Dysgonomonas sp. OttesenSCG-928-M03]|nr:hypothetical protein [Dysgonomonas sp. OttesenSCG-928-M03]